jgi:hypothetical protein
MADQHILVARLNAKLQPMHRGEIFEDPLDEELKRSSVGSVSGGGTQMGKSGEIEFCDIEISVNLVGVDVAASVVQALEALGAPKGSKLQLADGQEIPFGTSEGLALYLNGTDLPPAVYQESDSNFVYGELDRLLDGEGQVFSYWEGPTETAFYMYGKSFATMSERIRSLLTSYPLCQKCRVVQIA